MVWACEKNGDEKAPVKAKKFVVEGSKKDQPKKRWKEMIEKDMLERGLKSTDAQDCSLWRLAAKTGSPLFAGRRILVPGERKNFSALLDVKIIKLLCLPVVFRNAISIVLVLIRMTVKLEQQLNLFSIDVL